MLIKGMKLDCVVELGLVLVGLWKVVYYRWLGCLLLIVFIVLFIIRKVVIVVRVCVCGFRVDMKRLVKLVLMVLFRFRVWIGLVKLLLMIWVLKVVNF